MAEKNNDQAPEPAAEAVVIANAIHDLADAIRLLAQAQAPDDGFEMQNGQTLD